MTLVILLLVFATYCNRNNFAAADVELPCETGLQVREDLPDTLYKPPEYSCRVVDIPGDLTEEVVHILPEDPRLTVNVTIKNVHLGHLPFSLFQLFPNIKYLRIDHCGIDTLDAFETSPSLQWLHLPRNKLTEIGERQLSRRIRVLEITSNRIRRISERAFEDLTQLVWLNLAGNLLDKLPRYVFNAPLEYINLERNRLTSADRIFRSHFELKYLNLGRNRLRTINRDTFHGLTGLLSLDLSWNRIETVDSKSFDMLERLELLKLTGNKLLELVIRMPSRYLQMLFVDQNLLYRLVIASGQQEFDHTSLQLYAHNNEYLTEVLLQKGLPMRTVWLQNNNLTDLRSITGFRRLVELDLSGNDLSNVNFNHLISTPNIEILTLRQTNLQPHQLQQILNLSQLWVKHLDVSYNPALANFEFGDPSGSPVETLLMTGCDLRALNARKIVQTLQSLRKFYVDENRFACGHLTQQIMELNAVNVAVVGDDGYEYNQQSDANSRSSTAAQRADDDGEKNSDDDGEGGDSEIGDGSRNGGANDNEAKHVNNIRCY